MAKKEKKIKQKKEKQKKVKQPELPYAGSDRLKSILATTLIILCVFLLGLAFFTIRQWKSLPPASLSGGSVSLPTSESHSQLSAETASTGEIWFSLPDGTFVQGNVR